jgi:hypothetical protein
VAATLLIALGVVVTPAPAQQEITAETLTDEHVRLAIDAIVEALYQRKRGGSFWEPKEWKYSRDGDDDQAGGYTALTILALLYAGQSYQDPRLHDAVMHLKTAGLSGTYAIAVRANVWSLLPPRFEPQLETDAEWLMDGFSEAVGGWDYTLNPRTQRRDNSLRQYGALGLWEAAKRGVDVDARYWRRLENAFIDNQMADGGWNYRGDDGVARGSMTAAGLTVLFITQDYLHAAESFDPKAKTDARHGRAIDLGLDWMDQNFSPTFNPGRDSDFYYYLYGVERVGLASGYKRFGEYDWYRAGTAELIRRLCKWDPETRTMTAHERIGGRGNAGVVQIRPLAFALMFISRGRVPTSINKLQVTSHAWNNRPRDVANLNRWITGASETALNWQIVDFEEPPEDWLDAPVLYLASHEALPWVKSLPTEALARAGETRRFDRQWSTGQIEPGAQRPEQPESPELAKLKQYLDLGGMLLAVNEGNGSAFADSVETLGSVMYPQYEWRNLSPDHWAYRIHWPVAGRKPPLRGLSNGVRELIVLSPGGDLARTFQANDQRHLQDFQTAANLYFYASELNRPRPRLSRHSDAPRQPGAADDAITIVQAAHGGNWNPEPLALPLFARVTAPERGIDVQIKQWPLSGIDQLSPPPAVVVVSGTGEHTFTDAERKAVKAYIESGGTILFEAAGGRGAFALSAERMATEVFKKPIRTVVRTPIISGRGLSDAPDLTTIDYRPFSFEVFGGQERGPRLRGIKIDGEPRVLFSREDLSHGMLNQPCWGVSGYAPHSARDLMGNIVQFATDSP